MPPTYILVGYKKAFRFCRANVSIIGEIVVHLCTSTEYNVQLSQGMGTYWRFLEFSHLVSPRGGLLTDYRVRFYVGGE